MSAITPSTQPAPPWRDDTLDAPVAGDTSTPPPIQPAPKAPPKERSLLDMAADLKNKIRDDRMRRSK